MEATILDSYKAIDDYFLQYLINELQKYLLENVNEDMLQPAQVYLILQEYLAVEIIDVFNEIVNNIIYISWGDKYTLKIDPSKEYKETGYRLITLAKLINYGGISLKPYRIFTEGFKYIEDNSGIIFLNYMNL